MLTKGELSPGVDIRVILLGTGGPELSIDRQGAATLVQVGTEAFLFDAGRGVLQRLYECKVRVNSVHRVLFTHLHSDHIEGLPGLWITPWFLLGRSTPMSFWGPVGTKAMLDGMRRFLGHDVAHRVEDDSPAESLEYSVTEICDEGGVVNNIDNVRITAIPVDHKDGNPAFGYLIECAGRKVVISGDCTLSEDLIRWGEDADVVIHNVYAPSASLLAEDAHKRKVAEKLASPEQVAEVFRRTRTRYGVLTHVIRMDSSLGNIVERTRRAGYNGPLAIGEDRMAIDIGREIRVHPPAAINELAEVTRRVHG